MDRVAKETFVTELRDRLNKAPVVYLTDFTGLSVKEMTGLRRSDEIAARSALSQRWKLGVGQ